MHKIDAPHATPNNEFTDGNPATGIEATELIAKWFTMVQRELVAVVTAAGLTLSDLDDDQVLEAITTLLSSHANLTSPHGATAAATPDRVALRDANGRAAFAAGVAAGDAVNVSQIAALPNATPNATPDVLVLRDGGGRASFGKGLVDTANPAIMSQFDLSSSENGYMIFPNGFAIQWGVCEGSEDAWGLRNYPIAFTNPLCIVGSGNSAIFATNTDIQLDLYSNTQFRVVNNAYPGGSIRWVAIGVIVYMPPG